MWQGERGGGRALQVPSGACRGHCAEGPMTLPLPPFHFPFGVFSDTVGLCLVVSKSPVSHS